PASGEVKRSLGFGPTRPLRGRPPRRAGRGSEPWGSAPPARVAGDLPGERGGEASPRVRPHPAASPSGRAALRPGHLPRQAGKGTPTSPASGEVKRALGFGPTRPLRGRPPRRAGR